MGQEPAEQSLRDACVQLTSKGTEFWGPWELTLKGRASCRF